MLSNAVIDKSERPIFPKLMYWRSREEPDNWYVVLFTEPRKGTIVYVSPKHTTYKLGWYSSEFYGGEEGYTAIYFKDFLGKITLSN